MQIVAVRGNLVRFGLACASLVVAVGCGASTASPSAAASSPPGSSSGPARTSPAASVATASSTPTVAAICTPAPIKFDPKVIDLTGAWAGDDGGIYYARQLGNVVWWNGMSTRDGPPADLGRDWNNVGRGEIKDLTIVAEWADVPRGGINGSGQVDFKIGADSAGNVQLTKTKDVGSGRGDTKWTRCQAGFPRG